MSYYYLIEANNGEILHFEDAGDVAQYIIENADLSDAYDEWLDCDGAVDVAGLSFYPSTIIKECDPIAYNCGYSDYTDSLYDDIKDDVDRMGEGDTETFYEIEVECHEYDED